MNVRDAGPVGPSQQQRRGRRRLVAAALAVLLSAGGSIPSAAVSPARSVTLTEFGAGTLAVPFKAINAAFQEATPHVAVQAQFGGSVKMAKQITQLHQPADVLAVADYNVIPQQLYAQAGKPGYANWYVGFASNAITFVYTTRSKGADQITADNWYRVLAEPGVEIGRSNPDTDPSGYQTLQLLQLAERYYHRPGLAQAILKNAPKANMRDTETELIGALEAGQLDYLAIYRSDAIQHRFPYLRLPPQIDLSDAGLAAQYATVSVQTKNGELAGKPIIYALTIPTNAPHPRQAELLARFVLGAAGQAELQGDGFVLLRPPLASGVANLPSGLKAVVEPWPGQP